MCASYKLLRPSCTFYVIEAAMSVYAYPASRIWLSCLVIDVGVALPISSAFKLHFTFADDLCRAHDNTLELPRLLPSPLLLLSFFPCTLFPDSIPGTVDSQSIPISDKLAAAQSIVHSFTQMPLYFREYDRSGYPPISSEELNASFRQYATLTLTERMRFRLLHGGRPLGQTIPQKQIPKMDPTLVIDKATARAVPLPTPRPPSSRRLEVPNRAPLRFRRATREVVVEGIREGWQLGDEGAGASREEVVDEDVSAFCVYQRPYGQHHKALLSPLPSLMEITQEFLASVNGQEMSRRSTTPGRLNNSLVRQVSDMTKMSEEEAEAASPPNEVFCAPPQTRVLLPDGCDPLQHRALRIRSHRPRNAVAAPNRTTNRSADVVSDSVGIRGSMKHKHALASTYLFEDKRRAFLCCGVPKKHREKR
eukprot:gene4271-3088_t